MLTTIQLAGPLAQHFNPVWRLDLDRPCAAEAVRALRAVCPGFADYVIKHSEPGFHVLVDGADIAAEELGHPTGGGTITILPVLAGAGGAPVFKIIVGAVLIAAGAAAVMTGIGAAVAPTLIGLGVSTALGGVSQLLFAPPEAKPPQESHYENRPNGVFNGPVNTMAMGHPVPICYGEMEVGSQVISAGITTEFHGRGAFGGDGSGQTGVGGAGPTGGTCPAPWVPILLADGSSIAAGALRPGMRVRTQHEHTMEWGDYTVTEVRVAASERWLLVLTNGRAIAASFNHRVYVAHTGWVEMRHLRSGDHVIGDAPATVMHCTKQDNGLVMKITVDGAHTYVTSGILSHNIKRTPDLELP